jgi:hypothetical protein
MPGAGARCPQPGLPLKKGRAATLTHDYKRHGTTTLFAALNVLDGTVIGQCQARHRHGEWLKFLRQIDRETPQDKTLHLICDNYATHKHPKVKRWLKRHPRFHIHPHLGILDEHGRAILPRPHHRAPAPGGLHQRAGTDRCHKQDAEKVHPGLFQLATRGACPRLAPFFKHLRARKMAIGSLDRTPGC